jgi:hypothetical protein
VPFASPSGGSWRTLGDLACAWWAEEGAAEPRPAHDLVFDLCRVGDDDCLDLLDALVDAAADDEALVDLGPGPVEDLLSHFGHPRFAEPIAQRAERDPRWRLVLSELWLGADVPADVRMRLAHLGAIDLTKPNA